MTSTQNIFLTICKYEMIYMKLNHYLLYILLQKKWQQINIQRSAWLQVFVQELEKVVKFHQVIKAVPGVWT